MKRPKKITLVYTKKTKYRFTEVIALFSISVSKWHLEFMYTDLAKTLHLYKPLERMFINASYKEWLQVHQLAEDKLNKDVGLVNRMVDLSNKITNDLKAL